MKQPSSGILIALSVVLVVIAGGAWALSRRSGEQMPAVTPWVPVYEELGGPILTIDASRIIFRTPNGSVITLPIQTNTKFYEPGLKKEIPFSSFKVGDWVSARGMHTRESELVPEWIRQSYAPGEQPPELDY